jgi:hypothetical protein
MLASPTELTQAQEVEDTVALASTCEDADGLIQKVALLKGELTKTRRAWEVAEEKFCNMTIMLADDA